MWWTSKGETIDRSRKLVDFNTGEILADEDSGDRIKYIKAGSVEAFNKIKEEQIEKGLKEFESKYKLWEYKSFFKGNIEEIRRCMEELDTYEKAFLYSIASYVGYDDCCLKFDNGVELTFEKMVEISGISKGKLSSVIQGLIKKDILYKGKNSNTTQYFVNPFLFCKGYRINKVLKRMFGNYKIKSKNNIKWKDL